MVYECMTRPQTRPHRRNPVYGLHRVFSNHLYQCGSILFTIEGTAQNRCLRFLLIKLIKVEGFLSIRSEGLDGGYPFCESLRW